MAKSKPATVNPAQRENPVVSPKYETRVVSGVKFRMEKRDGKDIAVGYAAVFNKLSLDLGGFREKVAPGAFANVLKSAPDTRALFNHDPNKVLGRSTAGTLKMMEDDQGLRVEVELPQGVSYADDLKILMERGDIDQMSFGFVTADGGDEWARDDSGPLRTLTEVAELNDVSVVTYPAYPDTRVAMRSLLANPEVVAPTVIPPILETEMPLTTDQMKMVKEQFADAWSKRAVIVLPKGVRAVFPNGDQRCGGYGYGMTGNRSDLHSACTRAMESCRSAHDAIHDLHNVLDDTDHAPNGKEKRALHGLRNHMPVLVRACRGMGLRMDKQIKDGVSPGNWEQDDMYGDYDTDQDGGQTGWLTDGTGGDDTGDPGDGMMEDDKGTRALMERMQKAQELADKGEPVPEELRKVPQVTVNSEGISHAKSLIESGKINHGKWDQSKVERTKANANWFAAVDKSEDEGNKGHWMFPICNGGEVYSKAVGNALSRAKTNGYTELAKELQGLSDAIAKRGEPEKQAA